MKIKINMTKENVKILQRIKLSNPSDITFKVHVEEKMIEVLFNRLEVNKNDYLGLNDNFLAELKTSLDQSDSRFSAHTEGSKFIVEEITGKKILLVLTADNTIALEELKAQNPDKTQIDILNHLIKLGYSSLKKSKNELKL
jgi:hypothetical protein